MCGLAIIVISTKLNMRIAQLHDSHLAYIFLLKSLSQKQASSLESLRDALLLSKLFNTLIYPTNRYVGKIAHLGGRENRHKFARISHIIALTNWQTIRLHHGVLINARGEER